MSVERKAVGESLYYPVGKVALELSG